MLNVTVAAEWDSFCLTHFPDELRGDDYQNDLVIYDTMVATVHSIQRYIGHYIGEQTYVESIPGYEGFDLYLMQSRHSGLWPGRPVTDIASIEDIKDPQNPIILDPEEYHLHDDYSGHIRFREPIADSPSYGYGINRFQYPGGHYERYRVTYTSGWTTHEYGTIPRDLYKAIIDATTHRYYQSQQDTTVSSLKIGSLSIERGAGGSQSGGASGSALFPQHVMDALAPYASTIVVM